MTEKRSPKTKTILTIIVYSLLAIAGITLDQITKAWAQNELKPIGEIRLWDGVFHLTYMENTGAAFSILEGQQILFSVLTAAIIILIIYLISSGTVKYKLAEYTLLFIAIGGTGNLIDRVTNGYVVDMFDFTLINFAVFNVADIFVTCGSILFLLIFIIKKGDIFR